MSTKKIEHFEYTEFGPMSRGYTIETTHCENCDKLQSDLARYREQFAELQSRIERYESGLFGGLSSDARRIFEMVKEARAALEEK